MFDIKDFYPSISESLLKEALNFVKRHTEVKKEDVDIVMHARKSLLFNKEGTWIKRTGGLFDVTMGAYDGAEVCELVGTFLLNIISEKCDKKEIGLYRDDGLAIFKNRSGPENEKMKKFIQKTTLEFTKIENITKAPVRSTFHIICLKCSLYKLSWPFELG